jgi:hypothetical protein
MRENIRSLDRLPTEELEKVSAENVWRAVERLMSGYSDHPFGPSTDFDLVVDGSQRLPPKAVFGLAASEALGFQVLPRHFTGGLGTPCFRILEESGFEVVPKGQPASTEAPPMPEEIGSGRKASRSSSNISNGNAPPVSLTRRKPPSSDSTASSLAGVAVADDRLQTAAVEDPQGNGDARAHAPESHDPNPSGIRSWIQPSDH